MTWISNWNGTICWLNLSVVRNWLHVHDRVPATKNERAYTSDIIFKATSDGWSVGTSGSMVNLLRVRFVRKESCSINPG